MTTLRAPLAVSIGTGVGLRDVTRHVRDLEFSHTAPGGAADCSFRLRLRRHDLIGFGATSRVVVSDARSGRGVWEGYAEYPEPVRDAGGEFFHVSAIGGMVLLVDEVKPRFFVDGPAITEGDRRWRRVKMTSPGAQVDVSSVPSSDDEDDRPAVVLQFPSGQTVDNGSRTGMEYVLPVDSGTPIMFIIGTSPTGVTNNTFGFKITGRNEADTARHAAVAIDFLTNTTVNGGWFRYEANGGASPYLRDLRLQLHRESGGATTIAGDAVWVAFARVAAVARLAYLDGTRRDGNTYSTWLTGQGLNGPDKYPVVPASWVIEDLIGTLPNTLIDKAASSVDPAAAWLLDQLAYPDGATVAQVLDDLSLFEPDHTWLVTGRTAAGGHAFHYRTWQGRYTIPASAGTWDESGADIDLCNRVLVTWQTTNGGPRSLAVTTPVPELGDRIRDADPIALPDGVGSVGNAQRIGEKILAATNNPPAAGTFTAHGRIFDRLAGRAVEPWEVESGWKATLEETGQTMRLTDVAYTDNTGLAVLTLGRPSPTLEERLARMEASPRRPRSRRVSA